MTGLWHVFFIYKLKAQKSQSHKCQPSKIFRPVFLKHAVQNSDINPFDLQSIFEKDGHGSN